MKILKKRLSLQQKKRLQLLSIWINDSDHSDHYP